MPEILFPKYRAYVDSRVEVNNAMMALLAGSRLAAHTLSLTVGSTATLSQVFPAVEHIRRFDLRSDSARQLLSDADQHIASVAVPYALATHEEFVTDMLGLLSSEGRTLVAHGKRIKAWNMHEVLFETCGYPKPAEWMETFHVLREMRNCIIHAGGDISPELIDRIAGMSLAARTGWKKMHLNSEPEALHDGEHLALTAEDVFTAFAVTKRLGREVNAALGQEFEASTWARIAIVDYQAETSKTRNSSGWRRSAVGYARQFYNEVALDESVLEKAARNQGLWTAGTWTRE